MGNADLMNKYQITSKGLHSVFVALLEAKAAIDGTCPRSNGSTPTAHDVKRDRRASRQYLMVHLPVYFGDNLAEEGMVLDMTEHGLQIVGLESKKGKTESILIQPDDFADIYPFQLDAECRWTGRNRTTGQPVAGFEIVGISEGSMKQLRRLVSVLSLGESETEPS